MAVTKRGSWICDLNRRGIALHGAAFLSCPTMLIGIDKFHWTFYWRKVLIGPSRAVRHILQLELLRRLGHGASENMIDQWVTEHQIPRDGL